MTDEARVRGDVPPTERATSEATSRGTIGWGALALLMVATVGSMAQLSDSATFGLAAVSIYAIAALLFLLPCALVSAELGTSLPGGIFVWVRAAYGDRAGFQATWCVLMFGVALFPSVLSFGAASFAGALGRPDLAQNGVYMCAMVLAVFWLSTWVVTRGLQSSTLVGNIGLLLGTVIPAMALITFFFAWQVDDEPALISFRAADLMPPVNGLSSLALVVGTFVAFTGIEMNAVHVSALRGRPTNYVKAILLASVTVVGMYMLGSLAISLVVPDATLQLTAGPSEAFAAYAAGLGVPIIGSVLSALLVLGALAATIAWISGPSRSMLLVGRAGYLPRFLQRTNRNDVQTALLLLQGAVVTVLAFVFVAAPNTAVAFGFLQDVAVILYLIMYLLMFAAAITLRRRRPDLPRPVRIPGLAAVAALGMACSVFAVVLGLTPPPGSPSGEAFRHAALVATGVLLLAVPPQLIYRLRRPSWRTDPGAIDDLEHAD